MSGYGRRGQPSLLTALLGAENADPGRHRLPGSWPALWPGWWLPLLPGQVRRAAVRRLLRMSRGPRVAQPASDEVAQQERRNRARTGHDPGSW